MHVSNLTYLYTTKDYDNFTFNNCTHNENNIDIILPSLILKIPCGLSFICLMSSMV